MSNLGLGQTTWNRVFREFGLQLAQRRELVDLQRKYSTRYNRTQVREFNDVNASTSLWTFSGVKIGTNTDEDGFVYVRITDGAPNTVDVYKAAGGAGGDKVATGTGADGATVTLAAANSSGLTGTVKLATIGANETNDLHKLQLFPDWGLRADVVWDGTVADDADSKKIFLDTLPRVESQILGAISLIDLQITQWLAGRFADLMQSGQTKPIVDNTTNDGGVVSTGFAGVLEDGRLNMADETTPAAQKVVENTVTAAAGVFDAANTGQGTINSPSLMEWAGQGTITGICDDDTVGSETFVLTFKDSTTGAITNAKFVAQVGKLYSDPVIGIAGLLISRTLSFDTGDTNNFATAADYTIDGITPGNTNDGVLYMKLAAGTVDPAKFVIKFYKSSSYASSSLVAVTEEGAANASVGINYRGNSGLSGTAKIGSSPTAGNTRTLNINTFRTENSNNVPDKWTIAVTVSSRGEFADGVAKAFRYRLNSVASGSETIDEGYVRAGTYPAYE